MFEIFLFINPIGTYCFDVEEEIYHAIRQLGIDASYRFIPLANTNTIKRDLLDRTLTSCNHCPYSKYRNAVFGALRYYHAIKLGYGNKRARSFLYNLQRALHKKCLTYDQRLVNETLKKHHINSRRLRQILDSSYLTESIEKDIALARQWQISNTPTAIFFNDSDSNCSGGYMLDGQIRQDEILYALSSQAATVNAKRHLRLI